MLSALVESVRFTDRYGDPRDLRRKPVPEIGITDPKVVPDISPLLDGDDKKSVGRGIDVLQQIPLDIENASMELQQPLGVENAYRV